jgi:Zn-dependent peptidase ImmA (M78 family)
LKERHQFERQSQYWLESYIRLENRLGQPLKATKRLDVPDAVSGQEAAKLVREKFKLRDSEPIPSVIEILEAFGVRTMEMPTELPIDGFAARLGSEPVVILKQTAPNDRCRLNAAHELGHVLFGDCDSGQETTREMDNLAFEFASYLLMSPNTMNEAFVGRSAVKLVQHKERYGISMAAMIFRAEKQGIIDAQTTKRLWIQFSRRGWRANEPGTVKADRAIRFEQLLDQAISERTLTWSEASTVTGIKPEELRRRRDFAMGLAEEEEGADLLKMNG